MDTCHGFKIQPDNSLETQRGLVIMLNKTEKRLALLAIIFVVVYLGAAGLTLYNRSGQGEPVSHRLESAAPHKAESRLALVELFPPMMVLLSLTIAFLFVKKKRSRQLVALEESDDDGETIDYMTPVSDRSPSGQG